MLEEIEYERLKRVERNKDVEPGDKIRIVDAIGTDGRYENGDILTVRVGARKSDFAVGGYVRTKEVRPLIFLYEFEIVKEEEKPAEVYVKEHEKRIDALERQITVAAASIGELVSIVREGVNVENVAISNDERVVIIRRAQSYIILTEQRLSQEGFNYDKDGMDITRDCEVEYEVDTDIRSVFVAIRDTESTAVYAIGSSMSAPGDVFNEHIEKARAIVVALEIDKGDFNNVPQPNIVVEGMEVRYRANDGRTHVGQATDTGDPYLTEVSVLNDPDRDVLVEILDDTDAVYD